MAKLVAAATVTLITVLCPVAAAQSSSLFVKDDPARRGDFGRAPDGRQRQLNPSVARYSLSAVSLPQRRQFAVNDLISIIIREEDENSSDHSLETEKEIDLNGEVSSFPNLNLKDLLEFQLRGGSNENLPSVGLGFDKEFEGEGEVTRRDTYTGRIQARVIDVKPNGTLVLEARKHLTSDEESVDMILTGTCRAEDVTAANTIVSTQLYDLRLIKEHQGELRKGTKKGILTKFFEALFAF